MSRRCGICRQFGHDRRRCPSNNNHSSSRNGEIELNTDVKMNK